MNPISLSFGHLQGAHLNKSPKGKTHLNGKFYGASQKSNQPLYFQGTFHEYAPLLSVVSGDYQPIFQELEARSAETAKFLKNTSLWRDKDHATYNELRRKVDELETPLLKHLEDLDQMLKEKRMSFREYKERLNNIQKSLKELKSYKVDKIISTLVGAFTRAHVGGKL
ncbi:MAG: hypothetical protein K2X66_00445 [Cyanobacteria bacterium]|nr:hypothetical protein [Cyanobacteriota bacterium]